MSDLDFSFTFEMPSYIKVDYKYVEDVLAEAKLLGFSDVEEEDEDLKAGEGWTYDGKIMALLVQDQPQFNEIEEDEDGYKRYTLGIANTLREAYDMAREPFDDPELADRIDHRINGSEEAFQAALAAE